MAILRSILATDLTPGRSACWVEEFQAQSDTRPMKVPIWSMRSYWIEYSRSRNHSAKIRVEIWMVAPWGWRSHRPSQVMFWLPANLPALLCLCLTCGTCSQALGHPPLTITFLDGGRVVAFDSPVSGLANATGCVEVILHPIRTDWNKKMLHAINSDAVGVMQTCLCAGQDPNTAFANGFTSLSYSANHAATACLNLLLTAKASPNMRGFNGNTALHHAVYTRHIEAVQVLLQHGADADALDARATTSAHWASQAPGLAASACVNGH